MPTYTPKFLRELAGTPAPARTLEPSRATGLAAQVRPVPPQPVSTPLGQVPMQNLSNLSGSALYAKKLEIARQQQDSEIERLKQANGAPEAQDVAAIQKAHDAYLRAVQNYKVGSSEWGGPGPEAEMANAIRAYEGAKQTFSDNVKKRDAAVKAVRAQQDQLYARGQQAVQHMQQVEHNNDSIDQSNQTSRAAYDKNLEDYNNGTKSFQDYQAAKIAYEQQAAQRESDISGGKYNVDPYRFIHQGASLPEILELRRQLNSGTAKPLMRVPTAPTAPTEVQAPGEKPADYVRSEHQQFGEFDPEVTKLLGYTPAPAPAPAAVPPAPAPAPEAKPVPETKPAESKPAEAKPAVAPQPQTPAPLTTQTTASQSNTPTQQTVTQPVQPQEPINKATSLEQQTAGTVAGQASSTTSQKPQPQATPQNVANPKPFSPPDPRDKEENVWEI